MNAPADHLELDSRADDRPPARGGMAMWLTGVAALVVAIPVAVLVGPSFGTLLLLALAAAVAGVCALRSPTFAAIMLLITICMRLALKTETHFPSRLFLVALVVLLAASVLWMWRTPNRLRGFGGVEWVMALYLMWNIYSMFAPHRYPAGSQLPNAEGIVRDFSVFSYIAFGTLIPFVLYVVGRYVFDRVAAVRAILWTILALAAYAAAMSILPFTGPKSLVWPRYVVDDPGWVGRAVGIFNQPVVNGMLLTLGFAIAMFMSNKRYQPGWPRWLAIGIATACGYGIFLTHTRAVWLSAVVVLIIGALMARGNRTGFIGVLAGITVLVAVNWSAFVSSDRQAGGVGSPAEVEDRLNTIQTALWAAGQKPLTGWGIGRFPAINTFHHQQWPGVEWIRGYGIASHENELGILAELGFIGLVLWLSVLMLITYRLWRAFRDLPDGELCGKPIAIIAIMAIAILVCAGVTVDLRFFDFPTPAIFLLAGIAVGWSDRFRQRHEVGMANGSAEHLRPLHV